MFSFIKNLFKPYPYPKYKNGKFQGSNVPFRELNSEIQELLPLDTLSKNTKALKLVGRLKNHISTYGDSRIVEEYYLLLLQASKKLSN